MPLSLGNQEVLLGRYVFMRIRSICPNLEQFDKCQGTSRHVIARTGTESQWVIGASQNEGVKEALTNAVDVKKAGFNSLSDCLTRLMSDGYFNSWEQFATTK